MKRNEAIEEQQIKYLNRITELSLIRTFVQISHFEAGFGTSTSTESIEVKGQWSWSHRG